MKTAVSTILATIVAVAALGYSVTTTSALSIKLPPRKPVTASTYQCGNDLGYLRRVFDEEVAAIEDPSVLPVCESDELMRSDGNAGGLRQEIAANDFILEALDRANFTVEDVIAVRMTGDESAVIYVHPFHR